MHHQTQLDAYRNETEEGILQYLPPEDARPARLHSAMRYSLQAGGKRLRPILILAARDLFDRGIDALPAAVAMECLHSYTLIHDDLPCMDDSDLRRGKHACHVQYDEATAVLAGDALLTHAFLLLGTAYGDQPHTAGRLVSILAKAAGSEHLVGGQMEDIANEGQQPDPQTLDYIHRNKTAALLTAALHMGAVLGKADPEQVQTLLELGECLGLTFQIVDDLLDQNATEAQIGKPVQADTQNQKSTYLSVHGQAEARERIASLTEQAATLCRSVAGQDSFLEWLSRKLATRAS